MTTKEEMAAYIIRDTVDDFGDVIDGVKQLTKMFNDPNLDTMLRQLQDMKTYVEHKSPATHGSSEPGKRYAIWYYNGIDYIPASVIHGVKDVYTSQGTADRIANQLSSQNPGIVFNVYPINHNYEISGNAVSSYGKTTR